LIAGLLFAPPAKLEHEGARFIDVSCGKEHFMALTEDGDVYTWGSGRSPIELHSVEIVAIKAHVAAPFIPIKGDL